MHGWPVQTVLEVKFGQYKAVQASTTPLFRVEYCRSASKASGSLSYGTDTNNTARKAGGFHSHPWPGRISAPRPAEQIGAPLPAGRINAPQHGPRQPPPPQPIALLVARSSLLWCSSLARAFLARAPPLRDWMDRDWIAHTPTQARKADAPISRPRRGTEISRAIVPRRVPRAGPPSSRRHHRSGPAPARRCSLGFPRPRSRAGRRPTGGRT